MGEMIKKKRRREDEEKVRRGKDAGGVRGQDEEGCPPLLFSDQ